MGLSDEALDDLRKVLHELGYSAEVEAASREDLEQFGKFLLNLTAAAIKTREKLRSIGIDVPPSEFSSEGKQRQQPTLPGFGD